MLTPQRLLLRSVHTLPGLSTHCTPVRAHSWGHETSGPSKSAHPQGQPAPQVPRTKSRAGQLQMPWEPVSAHKAQELRQEGEAPCVRALTPTQGHTSSGRGASACKSARNCPTTKQQSALEGVSPKKAHRGQQAHTKAPGQHHRALGRCKLGPQDATSTGTAATKRHA